MNLKKNRTADLLSSIMLFAGKTIAFLFQSDHNTEFRKLKNFIAS